MLAVPYFKQNRDYTCGPVCLRMVLAYWGHETDEVSLSMLCGTTVFGTSGMQIVNAAQRLGLEVEYPMESLYERLHLAVKEGVPPIVAIDATILYPQQEQRYTKHDIVLLEINTRRVVYHDPAVGSNLPVSPAVFKKAWQRTENEVIFIWPVEKMFTTKLGK
ncbi:MAG: cysteine peptidase family C39 domain-containing protein [candidate division KSB1 bacterium]